MNVLSYLLSSVVVILTIIYLVLKKKYNYWKVKNVPHSEPTFLLGNYGGFLTQKETLSENVTKLCKKFPKEPYIGAFMGTVPILIVQDPETLRIITTKEFASFNSRELMDYVHRETFGRSLILTHGEDWKFTRSAMTPMFSTLKLKNMFPLIEQCAADFEKHLNTQVKRESFDARKLMTSYTLSAIVSCAFGIDLKNSNVKEYFIRMGDMFFESNWLRSIVLNMRFLYPSFFYVIGLRSVPKSLIEFFRNLLTDVFQSRGYKPSQRNDFIDGLLSLTQNTGIKDKRIDDEYMIAQSIAIFVAGFETSAETLSFTLYELAKNQEIQKKVCQEIDEFLDKSGGKITYECSNDLPYSEACFKETMRMYPILGVLTREVTKNFVLSTGVELERGLRIHIPVYHLHHNPDFFPDPTTFQPERFYRDQKQVIIPSSYLPFGDGPRLCIGKRFAKMQFFVGLISILKDHKIILDDKMPSKIEYETTSLTTQFKSAILLKRLPRK